MIQLDLAREVAQRLRESKLHLSQLVVDAENTIDALVEEVERLTKVDVEHRYTLELPQGDARTVKVFWTERKTEGDTITHALCIAVDGHDAVMPKVDVCGKNCIKCGERLMSDLTKTCYACDHAETKVDVEPCCTNWKAGTNCFADPYPNCPHLKVDVEPVKLSHSEDFCYCDHEISLQRVSGGATPEGLYGRVTLQVKGEYVDYVPASALAALQAENEEAKISAYQRGYLDGSAKKYADLEAEVERLKAANKQLLEKIEKKDAILRQVLEALEKAADTTYSDTCLAQFNAAITTIKEELK